MTRAARHEMIRAGGFGEKLDRLIALLGTHKAAFEEVVRLNDGAHDRTTNFLLEQLALKADAGLRAIEQTLDDPQLSASPYGSLGMWGENHRGPEVERLLAAARFHAKA